MNVISAHVCANWLIGQQIVGAEQGGEKRALYGKALLRGLSAQLSKEYGDGFSESALKYMRLFYLAYPMLLPPNSIRHAARDELNALSLDEWQPGLLHPGLSWTHYRRLIKEQRRHVRDFYEIESINNGWAARELERQMNTFLFERLAKSKDKQGLLALTREGQVVTTPKDVIKEPFVLEFYHVKLKCYVVIDLKVGKLSHGDLGQMLLYVNFYDQEVATQGDNPTIGLVFCQSLSV